MSKKLRIISKNFLDSGDLESAIFWHEKVCIINAWNSQSVYEYVIALIRSERYNCVIKLLIKYFPDTLWSKYYMAVCYSATENCPSALDLLEDFLIIDPKYDSLVTLVIKFKNEFPFLNSTEFVSDALFLKASLMEYSGHIDSTMYYSYSLVCNPMKFSCARRLFEDGLLTHCEIEGIIEEITDFHQFMEQVDQKTFKMAIHFYSSFINKNSSVYNGKFNKSWDVRRWKARFYLNNRNAHKSLEITRSIMSESSNQDLLSCVIHAIGLFQDLDSKILQLFAVEFPLSNSSSYFIKSMSFFITSLKYISEGKSNDAQASIQKAVSSNWCGVIRIQPWCLTPSLLYMLQGHASWNCGDNENALASFIAAADSTPGQVWPWFCVGVLHSRHCQFNLALPYLLRANNICDQSFNTALPLVINEIAYCLYHKKQYKKARKLLEKLVAHGSIQKMDVATINNHLPLFFLNLSQCFLKLNQYDEALKQAEKGLSFNISCSSLMRLIGYINDLLGHHEKAQLMYHRALFFSPQFLDLVPKHSTKMFDYTCFPPDGNFRQYRQQDVFCTEMLKHSSSKLKNK